jgi:hypothetical protein
VRHYGGFRTNPHTNYRRMGIEPPSQGRYHPQNPFFGHFSTLATCLMLSPFGESLSFPFLYGPAIYSRGTRNQDSASLSLKRKGTVENSIIYHFPKFNFFYWPKSGTEVFLGNLINSLINGHRDSCSMSQAKHVAV